MLNIQTKSTKMIGHCLVLFIVNFLAAAHCFATTENCAPLFSLKGSQPSKFVLSELVDRFLNADSSEGFLSENFPNMRDRREQVHSLLNRRLFSDEYLEVYGPDLYLSRAKLARKRLDLSFSVHDANRLMLPIAFLSFLASEVSKSPDFPSELERLKSLDFSEFKYHGDFSRHQPYSEGWIGFVGSIRDYQSVSVTGGSRPQYNQSGVMRNSIRNYGYGVKVYRDVRVSPIGLADVDLDLRFNSHEVKRDVYNIYIRGDRLEISFNVTFPSDTNEQLVQGILNTVVSLPVVYFFGVDTIQVFSETSKVGSKGYAGTEGGKYQAAAYLLGLGTVSLFKPALNIVNGGTIEEMSFQELLLHEIGHTLFLNHPTESERRVMRRYETAMSSSGISVDSRPYFQSPAEDSAQLATLYGLDLLNGSSLSAPFNGRVKILEEILIKALEGASPFIEP